MDISDAKDALQVVINARNLISNKEKWCQHNMAQNQYGFSVPLRSPAAFKLCASGALRLSASKYSENIRFTAKGRKELIMLVLSYFSARIGNKGLEFFNDRADHGHVIMLFDTVISDMQNDIESAHNELMLERYSDETKEYWPNSI